MRSSEVSRHEECNVHMMFSTYTTYSLLCRWCIAEVDVHRAHLNGLDSYHTTILKFITGEDCEGFLFRFYNRRRPWSQIYLNRRLLHTRHFNVLRSSPAYQSVSRLETFCLSPHQFISGLKNGQFLPHYGNLV